MSQESKVHSLINLLYFAAVLGLVFFLVRYVFFWLLPFILGFGIATLLRPAVMKISKSSHINKKVCAAALVALFYLSGIALLGAFLTVIAVQLYDLFLQLPQIYQETISPMLLKINDGFFNLAQRFSPDASNHMETLGEAVTSGLQQLAIDGSAKVVGGIAQVAGKLPMILIAAVFTFIISILISTNYSNVMKFFREILPRRFKARVSGLQQFMRDTIFSMVRAYIIIIAITFLELAAGLYLLGFDYWLSVAAIIALLDILPMIGSGTILVPWGLVLIAGSHPATGIGLLLLFAIIEIIRNIIEPKIVGAQIGLHPIVTITAMYAGLQIAGFLGLLCAPLAVLTVMYLYRTNSAE
ncbi:sporulation integral membrane protein YtvI [Youxingia wuxianensis]|uniref:Sporulation integral membrane protein YtvI n=1 Tax=Youxingia wuxianensis TaxID=2763678 RepID=A0A926IHH2_9FIRM|nr:sporulation integral membrane protein YtvI [Youxingia wuxianensis]MBC8584698.1 sporulation integral membrane protein YtvI [Youxingia wuxianensis]